MALINGTNSDDTLYGTGDADTINGKNGADVLVGFGGADRLDGGSGIDTAFYFDSTAGVSVNLATGVGFGGSAAGDTLISVEYLWGSNFNDALTGNSGTNDLYGLNGNDVLNGGLGADGLDGGSGNDILKGGGGADYLVGGEGSDTADYSQSSGPVYVYLHSGYANFNDATGDILIGIENLTGSDFREELDGDGNANVLKGGGGDDLLWGYGGSDRLEGGDGDDDMYGSEFDSGDTAPDTMIGGRGDDDYSINVVGDVVIENAGEGWDKVSVGIASYTMTDNVEEMAMGFRAGAGTAIGNGLDNVIRTNSEANILDGRGGADMMSGQGGNDLYVVDNAGDFIEEGTFGGASDRVETSVSYGLTAGAQVELFATTDASSTSAIDLTGNEFAQAITGNAGNNLIDGRGGGDTMAGGLGNDIYDADNALDTVIEALGGGKDLLRSLVTIAGLAANVENGTLLGTANINATGNALVNSLVGNLGANSLSGGDGNDFLIASKGNDKLLGERGADTLTGGFGGDQFIYGALDAVGDTINDFSSNASGDNDTFKFRGSAFGGLAVGDIAANQFEANTAGLATAATTRFIYETDARVLHFDSNGSAAGGIILSIATLQAGATMTFEDIAIF